MKTIRVGINGFGRIGRIVARLIFQSQHNQYIKLCHINDLASNEVLAQLFKYDSVHGIYSGQVTTKNQLLIVDNQEICVTNSRNPSQINWNNSQVDVVIESTGLFCTKELASSHLVGGAKKVILSAPQKGGNIPTVVLGVNDHIINQKHQIYSNASCTTNCLAPMVKILDDYFGVEQGFMTTIHAYTGDQRIIDTSHQDLRRARAAAINIIPTTTGAAKAVGLVLPQLQGKLDGGAIRVPVSCGSLTDFTATLSKKATVKEVNEIMQTATQTTLKNIMEFSCLPLVSTDIIGNRHSCIFDSQLTKASGKMIKVIGWYDNETGYSARVVDLISRIMNI